MLSKLYNLIKSQQQTVFLTICVGLVALISYNLGQISSRGRLPIKITDGNNVYQATAVSAVSGKEDGSQDKQTMPVIRDMRVVASKNSTTKKYHYTWCPSAAKIKDANKLWFASATEAESRGYTLAGNCTL